VSTIYDKANVEGVLSAHASASAQLVTTPCRLRGVHAVPGATAGTLQFRNGGASGTILLTIDTVASATSAAVYIALPGAGINFGTDLYCTVTNTAFVTALYAQ